LDAWGRVLLPECWTEERWEEACKEDKRLVYRCLVSLPEFFWRVWLPFKSANEMGWSSDKLHEVYPNGMPEFWAESLRQVQRSLPYELIITEKKPQHSEVWRMGWAEPTGHGKSMRFLEALPAYLIGINPSVTILAASATGGVGDRYIESAKDQITRNERYQWLFGKLHDDSSKVHRIWRTDAIEVDRPLSRAAPTFETIGYQGEIEGERYDVGLGDDIATFENARTPQAQDQQWDWWTGTFLRRLNADRRFAVLIGTPHWANDLLDRIKKDAHTKGTWLYHETPAILSGTWPPLRKDPAQEYSRDNVIVPTDCKVLWPEFWPIERLVEDFIESPLAFARTRQLIHQDPETKWFTKQLIEDLKADGGISSDGNTLKPMLSRWPEDIGVPGPGTGLYEQYCSYGLSPASFRLVISVDLATEEPKRSRTDPDYTVFQLWGMHRENFLRVLLNMRRFRSNDPAKISEMLRSWTQAYRPDKLLIEAVAVDRLFARSMREITGEPVHVVDPLNKKVEMVERIRDLANNSLLLVPYASDTFSGNVARNYNTRQIMRTFLEELDGYGGGGHNDTLMAASHALWDLRGGDANIGVKVVRVQVGGQQHLPAIRTLQRRQREGRGGDVTGIEKQVRRLCEDIGKLKAQALATGIPIIPPGPEES
jgi:hypothetical protein